MVADPTVGKKTVWTSPHHKSPTLGAICVWSGLEHESTPFQRVYLTRSMCTYHGLGMVIATGVERDRRFVPAGHILPSYADTMLEID